MNLGEDTVRQLPNPAICRAKPARCTGVVFCLVQPPGDCSHTRFFNDVAYCTHPNREAIISRTMAHEKAHSRDSDGNRPSAADDTE